MAHNRITVADMEWISSNIETISKFTKDQLGKDLLEDKTISVDMEFWQLNAECLTLLTHEHRNKFSQFRDCSAQDILKILKTIENS